MYASCATSLYQREAVAVGQAAVDDHRAIGDLARCRPRWFDSLESVDGDACIFERVSNQRGQPRMILNQQNSVHDGQKRYM